MATVGHPLWMFSINGNDIAWAHAHPPHQTALVTKQDASARLAGTKLHILSTLYHYLHSSFLQILSLRAIFLELYQSGRKKYRVEICFLAHSWRGNVLHTGKNKSFKIRKLGLTSGTTGYMLQCQWLWHCNIYPLWVTYQLLSWLQEKNNISIGSLLPFNSPTSIFKTIRELGQWSGEEEADRAVRV